MSRNRSRYLPSRVPEPPPVVPGLGPDSLAGLTPEAVAARAGAATERQETADRRAAGRSLAERVEAATPFAGPAVAPEPARPATPRESTAPASPASRPAPSRKPWRGAPLVVSTRRAEPEPPTFTPDDLDVLGRLLARAPHRTTTNRRNLP